MTGWLVGDDRAELLDRASRLAERRTGPAPPERFLDELPESFDRRLRPRTASPVCASSRRLASSA